MLSSAKISTGSWRYYTDGVACRAMEYYLGVGEAPGRWHGRGLAQFGLAPGAVVSEQQLEALFARGLHPASGVRLGRAWRVDGVTGFDLTFSAPKSVSALWALGDPATAAAVTAAHRAAVRAGLAYLDAHAGLSRRGTDGVEQVSTEGLVAAVFDHRTSRVGDPQLHSHALVLNKARCADGRWRALDATELYHHKKSAGMAYQAALRNELSRRLEVAFGAVSEHGQADIVGAPGELLTLWSKRAVAISAEAEPKITEYEKLLGRALTGSERVRVVKTAVLKTRPSKQHPQLSALHARWTAEAEQAGWTPDRLARAVRAAAGRGGAGADGRVAVLSEDELTAALAAAGHRRAVFSRADPAGEIAARLPTVGLTAVDVVARVEQHTDAALRLTEAVPVGRQPRGVTARASDARYATAEVLAAEARILRLAGGGRRGGYGQVPRPLLTAGVGVPGRLDEGQRAAVLRLAGGGDFLTVLTAPAGAGKTSMLGVAAGVWQQADYRVVGLAPSARAAAELAAATSTPTDTLAKWLHSRDRLADLPAAERAWANLDDRTVLLVDEASMASTLDLDRLTALAARAATKVVLVGDPGQIGVVNGPGGMLAALAHAGHGVELEQIHRFSAPWERAASLALRDGNPAVLGTYRAAGRLHPYADGDQALDAVFAHWTAARAEGQDAVMLARTRADVDALNTRARAAALAAGQVTGPITTAGGRHWQAGDLLRARRNDRRLTVGDSHVRNGDRYRVLGPGPDSGLIVEDLTGRGRTVLPGSYLAQHAEYGWAFTIDTAQGATTDVGIVLVRPGMDREHLYVGMTRGRHGNHAYLSPDPATDHHRHPPAPRGGAGDEAVRVLLSALAQSGAQDAAHTVLARARRTAAAETARQAEQAAATAEQAAATAKRQPPPARPIPVEHRQTVELLGQRRAQRDKLRVERASQQRTLEQARTDLAVLPRWALGRRRALTATITSTAGALLQSQPTLGGLDADVERLTRLVDHHTRQRGAADFTERRAARVGTEDPDRFGELARPGPSRPAAVDGRELAALAATATRAPCRDHDPYRTPVSGRDGGLSR